MSGNGATPPGPKLEDLVVITGYSGAGKSTAMNVFEDAGYFCVDNLPPEMIRALVELFVHEGSKVERAAVVSDVRGGEYFDGLARVLETLPRRRGRAPRAVPRRRRGDAAQPLQGDAPAPPARARGLRHRRHRREREMLAPLRERADSVVDTSGLSAAMLRRKIADEFLPAEAPRRLAVTFASFGYKHGPPRDADLVFDVRFLPNPHWEPELRPLTGFDARVVEYVGRDGKLDEFYDRLVPLLDFLLPQYVAEGKAHLVVAIGCTGGRHRSVAIAEHLAARYRPDDVLRRGPAPRRRPRTDARVKRPLASSPGT